MVPVEAAEFLSAQTRTYQVAAEGKVYEKVAVVLPPEASAVALLVPMSVALAPEELVACWKRLANPAPVDADPVFETVAESVTAVPTVADVGDTEPAVRLGLVPETVTVALADPVP